MSNAFYTDQELNAIQRLMISKGFCLVNRYSMHSSESRYHVDPHEAKVTNLTFHKPGTCLIVSARLREMMGFLNQTGEYDFHWSVRVMLQTLPARQIKDQLQVPREVNDNWPYSGGLDTYLASVIGIDGPVPCSLFKYHTVTFYGHDYKKSDLPVWDYECKYPIVRSNFTPESLVANLETLYNGYGKFAMKGRFEEIHLYHFDERYCFPEPEARNIIKSKLDIPYIRSLTKKLVPMEDF